MKKFAKDIRLGDRIMCNDGVTRTVDVIDFYGPGVMRFMFTDDKWLEARAGQKLTLEPKP